MEACLAARLRGRPIFLMGKEKKTPSLNKIIWECQANEPKQKANRSLSKWIYRQSHCVLRSRTSPCLTLFSELWKSFWGFIEYFCTSCSAECGLVWLWMLRTTFHYFQSRHHPDFSFFFFYFCCFLCLNSESLRRGLGRGVGAGSASEEEAAAQPDHLHGGAAGGAGESLWEDSLPRHLHQGGARPEGQAHWGQGSGTRERERGGTHTVC